MAQEHGFSDIWLSDHFHPWVDRQGQSPFVWAAPGGMAGLPLLSRRGASEALTGPVAPETRCRA